MKKVSIEVLLATFNGEKYIEDQIASILGQTHQDFRVLIRDDGSYDRTPTIIQSYTMRYPEKIIQVSDNNESAGVIPNFSRLIEISTAPYIMLSDQDDVWLPDKIERSLQAVQQIEQIHSPRTPILVHSDLCLVNETLDEIAPSFLRFTRLNPERDKFHQLLVQNVITGCSVILNRALADMVVPIPTNVLMHDWWIALIASGFGKVGFIKQPTILYRQHGENTLGARSFNLDYLYEKTKGTFRIRGDSILADNFKQAKAFKDVFASQLPPNFLALLNKFIELDEQNFLVRRTTLIKYGFLKGKFIQNVGLFLKI